jgi:hypothetical protein
MGRRWGGAVGILLLSLLWSTDDVEATWWLLNPKRTPGTVSGQVQVACGDARGVLVYLAGRSFMAFTDAGGQFVLDWVPPGTYVLRVETVEPAAIHEATIKVLSGRDTNVGTIQVAPDLQTDERHCGACNTQCAAGQTCEAGTCASPECAPGTVCQGRICAPLACPAGFGNCDFNPANGCETSLTTDSNCGGCGIVCAPGSTCQSGTCQPS